MSGLTGKGATSIKKQEVRESRIPAIGFNKIRFLHKLTAGATSISLTSLTAPSVSEAPNYSVPNVSQLTAVNLAQFPDNLELVSSVRGRLMRNMAFDIAGASTITLLYSADDGEIIEGKIDPVAVTGNTIVDAKPIVASGSLLAGTTDFNVGEPFEVGKFPLTQHGSVLVFLDNQLMLRNTGNQAPGVGVEGDYYEVHAGSGLGTIIRFNTPDLVNDRNVSVISVAALAERPNGSMMAFIENVSGKVDSLIPTVAALAEVDESTFGGVTNVDLKAFGDRVLAMEQDSVSQDSRLDILESETNIPVFSAYANLSHAAGAGTSTKVQLNSEETDTHNFFDSSTNYRFQPTIPGWYQLNGAVFLLTSAAARMNTTIWKNGAEFRRGNDINTAGSFDLSVSSLVYFNGTTDYAELYVFNGGAANTVQSGYALTYFNGFLVRRG